MKKRIRILLQTTIAPATDDCHIGRFGLLRELLSGLRDAEDHLLYDVVARDRGPVRTPDPVLSAIDTSDFDELWLFAVDVGDGLTRQDVEGIARFRRLGGGLLLTRDHMDLGCSICSIPGVGAAHRFHSHNVDPDLATHRIDDRETLDILWPNYKSTFHHFVDYKRDPSRGSELRERTAWPRTRIRARRSGVGSPLRNQHRVVACGPTAV